MKKINNILCIVEPNDNSEAALIHALKIAKDHQADITFVSVLNKTEKWKKIFKKEDANYNKFKSYPKEKLVLLKDWLNKYDISPEAHIKLYEGIGFIETIKDVIKSDYDLIVKCAENIDWLSQLFGSDDMHLLRKCPCPILMLNPTQNKPFKKVMATVDVNDDSIESQSEESNEPDEKRVQETLNKSVLNFGATFSLSDLTELHICSVWEAFGESHLRHSVFSQTSTKEVDSYVEQTRLKCLNKLTQLINESNKLIGNDVADYLQPKTHLIKGTPSKKICSTACSLNIDLIVMGSVARTGIPGFIIGNTAESILGQVTCSVLVVKPDGFVSPVTTR